MKKKIQLLFLFFTFSLSGQVLQSNFVHNWVYKSDDSDLMSPNGSVTDNYGITWIGTELGLLRYDGLNVKRVINKNYPQISTQRIKRMSKDITTGDVYFTAFPNQDWFKIKNGKIEKINPTGNTFYINTPNKKTLEFNDGYLKMLLLKQNTPVDVRYVFNKTSVLEISSVIKTKRYVYFHKFDQLIIVDLEQNYAVITYPLSIYNLLFNIGENIFFLKDAKYYQIIGTKVVSTNVTTDAVLNQFAKKYEITYTDNNRMMLTETGQSYIIFKEKLYKIEQEGNSLRAAYLFDSPSKDVNDLNYLDRENLFLLGGFASGLSKLTRQNFNQLVFKDPNLVNYSIVTINKDVVYSTSGWFYNLTTKEFKNDPYVLNRNKYFILEKEKEIYIQIENRILNLKNSNDSLITDRKNHLGFYSGSTFFDGKLWVSQANISNLLYFGDTKKITTDFFITKKLKGKNITFMMPLKDELLIATMKGLYAYQPKLKKIRFYKQLGEKYIRRLIKISENCFLICCYGDGVYIVDNGKLYKVKVDHVDFSAVHTIEVDSRNQLWISSNNGLFTVDKSVFIANTLLGKKVSLYKFSVKDGLVTNEFNGGSTHPSFKNASGLLGFASMKGMIWFDPNEIKKTKFAGPIYLDDVLSDGKLIDATKGIYRMESDMHLISIKLFYPYYHNRENLIVQYRIEGQKKWNDLVKDEIVFTRERRGDLEVMVRISTKGFGSDSAIQKSFHFYFAPRFYETTWFLVLCVLLFIGLLVVSFKIGLLLNEKKRRNLEQKIRFKTIKLEETNKMLYESREGISKSLKERELLLKEIHHRVKNNLQLVISLMSIQARRQNYIDINDFIEKGRKRITSMILIHQTLYQSELIDSIDVEEYMRLLSDSILESFERSDDISIVINSNNVKLNLNTAIPFGLIVNEIVTNSLKHAFPYNKSGSINMILEPQSFGSYTLVIEDNGVGFSTECLKKKSFGIELIRLLSAQLKGTFFIDNKNGTKFVITFFKVID